ncbi:DNA cytosine methyltransferase [Segatella copri]|uniref:DNA cytosine methyltransferase n=1 Tax=Segatella copri TaxID=165179 RepID=UPI00294B99C4|nr:DNA cytosine methyltransferase [Segatella copri]
MFDEQDRQYFYNEFKNNGYEVGSYDDFKKDLNNEEDRNWYYNEAKSMGYDVGTQADFDKMVLEPAPSATGGGKQVDASSTTQSVEQKASTETKPQVAQPAKKQETTDKDPGLIAKVLDMIPTGAQTSNGTYQPSPEIPQPVVKGEEMPVKEEASSSSSANAVSPESKEAAPVTTPTGVVNNEGLMDAKLANYLENWKQRPDKQSTYFENLVADLLADGTANSNEEAVSIVKSALGRYANRSAMDVTNQVVSSLPDDTVQDAEQSIEAQWYSHGVQDKLKQEAYNMGISYDDYVGLFLKPAMVQSLVNKYGPKYRDIAEGIATRLYSHDENVQDRLMNQDINDALSSVISKYVNPSVVEEYNKAQEAGSKAFTEGMEGSQFIPANLRLGTALGAQYEANEAKDPAKVLSSLQKKFGRLYRNPKFLNDMSNAAFKVMQRYGLNGTQSSDPKQFKPMINSVLKNELDQLEIKGMMPKGSAEYIMKTGLGNTIVGKIIRKAVQTDYQNWLEDIANQQYQPGFWENVASGALTFAGDAWSYWLPGAAGGKLTKSMVAKAEGKLAGDLMAKGMERKMAERAAKVLIGKSKAAALKSGAAHGAVTFGGQSAISKPIDEIYRTGQFDENGKIYNPSVGKVIANTLGEVAKQSAVGAIMQGGTIANMVGKGRGLATNILADIGGKVADSSIMTGQQILERMAHDPNFKPTGKDAAESFLESMANLTAIGLPGMVGKYARFKDAREFNKKFDFTDQDIAELKRFGYDGLRDAFEKMGIGEYAVVGENAQRLDGQLTQKYMDLMNDKSVPEVLKAKMMAVVEGKRPSSFSPIVDSIIVQPMDNGGKVYLETLNKDGGVVDRKEYSSLDEAQKADKKLEYEKTLGLASVLEGEFHNEFTQEHLDGLYNKAAQKYNMGEKLTDEDKAAVYLHQNAGAIKEIMDKQQKGIILTDEEQKQVNAYRHYYDSALDNSSVMREFVNTFEDSHGVARGTLRKALESKDKKYAPLVESYLKELYNSIELKREMKQIEDDKKRIEQGDIDGAKPATPVEGPASVEGSAGGQEPPISEEPAPYQDRTNSVPTPSDAEVAANPANSAAEGAGNEPKVASSDAFVMGQNAYKNGDSEALQAIDYNSDLATGRLKRAFADNEKMPDIVANAYNEGRDMEQFVAQRASSLTPAQKEAISKYVEAMDAKKGAIDALQHADDGYGEALKQQLWPYQTEDGNIVPATLDSGKQVFLKKANEYGGAFVVVPDEQGQPTIKQVSNAEIKEVGTPVSLDEYIENTVAQQKDARAQQFISQFDGSGLKPNDQVTVAMEEGDANVNMTFAGYSEDGKIVLTDGKDYLPLSKEEFAAWRKNALDNTINEHLDAEDDEREQKAASQAEADKKQRYANGIVGLSEGQPDYSSNDTDPNVAAEYLQEQFGEDHGKLLNLVNGSRDDIKTQLANKRKAAIEYQNWLDTNADLDPEKAKKVEDELSLVNEQIADLDARFKNWNTIRNSVMTPDEVKAMKEERKAEVEKAGVDESAIVPSDDFHVLVLDDKELKKQYPTMDEATDYITSQRKDLYHTQEDVERKINGVNDMLDQYINGETELDPSQLMELNTTKAQLEALQTNLSVAAKGLKAQANKLSRLYKTEVSKQEMEKLGMTPSEQRKALVADALKKNDMNAIHEIYKDASVDVMDLTPQTLEEAVSESLSPHSLNPESLQYELGKSNFKFGIGKGYDSNKFNYLIAKKGTGMSVNDFAVKVYNDLPVNLLDMGYSDQDVRNALLDMFKSYDSVKEMRNVALMNRIAAAEDELSSEEEYYEAQKEREIIERQAEIEQYKSYIHEKELSLPSESELDHINGLEFDRMMEIEDRDREYKQYVKSILPELADYDDRSNEEGYGGGSSLGSDSSRRGVDEGNSQGEEVGNGEASSESEIGEGSDSGRKGRQETGSMEPGEGSAVRGSHLPQEASFGERLKSAIAETETEPTEAQKKAGNYKKGHLSFGGYDYTVETPKGVTRSGKDEQGKPWSVTMHDTYGYILGKIGVDGDHIDMFINDAADLDTFDGNVYVVDQVNPETGEFDEHKVMYGYPSEEAATEAYLSNYSKGWKGLGKVTSVPKATFDKWLESSDRKTKPFAEYAMVQKEQRAAYEKEMMQDGAHSEAFDKIVDLAKEQKEYWDLMEQGEVDPNEVPEVDVAHEMDELLKTLSDEEFKEVSDVLHNIDEEFEYFTADEYERREDLAERKNAAAYSEFLKQETKSIAPFADALRNAVNSGDKKAIAKAQKELTDALLASNLGHGYLSGQLEYAKSAKKKDESYSERRAFIKPLTDAINAIESALDSALADVGLEDVHVDFKEYGYGWIYADKGSDWRDRLETLDNDYRNVSQYSDVNPISVLPQITMNNVKKVAGIIKSRIEEGERYNSDENQYENIEEAKKTKDNLPFHRDVKEVKPENLTEAQKVAYDAVSTMLKKAGIPVKVVSNEDMEKVAEAQDNMAVEMLLNNPRLRFYIKTPEQKEAAKAAYDWAAGNRPDKFKQYAIVNMDNPNQPPQYFEKKALAEKWRKYYTNAWKIGNYKAFNLNKPFEEQIKDVKGDVPSEFDPYKAESLLNKRIELEKQIKETEDSYNAKKKERAEYQNQLMQDYMDQHGLSSENDIPDDVWTDYRDKSFEKYQDTLDDLFHKYVELDNQLKAVAEPGVQYLKGKGVVYGYTDGKQIVLNQEHLNPNTPIHEYQHLWRTAAKEMNPELIEHGDKLIMQTQLFADLKQDPNYNHLTDEQICDEAFARLTGEDGAAILEQMAKNAIKENPLDTAKELSVINKLKEWLKKFWYWTLDTFTKWKPEDIKKMTLEDIRNLVLRDLANGVDPRTKLHEAENADDIKFMGSTTKKRMKDISTQLEGRELDEAQQAVADVYSGKKDNVSLTVEREDGSNKIIMRQGNDNHAGTKHSVFRHYGVKANSLNVNDLLLIPTVLKEGERKVSDNGRVAYVYVDPTSQVKYTVVTEPKNNKEFFNDFYSNKKANPSETSRVVENSTNTPEGAHNNDGNAFMRAKVDNNSETAKENGENLSVEDKIKAVSQQFGVDEADVAMYANGVKKGSTAEAARARANIKRHLLQANEDKISSFKELLKYTVPVNNALKENFGDLDAMIEERVKQVEAQRNAMEAARKRAEEEEAKRQKHLEELSLIPDDQLDKQYMDALAKGDDATAREMLDEAARRKGYDDTESSYQGVGAWAAPGNPGYESDKARRDDWESSGSDVNLEDMAMGYTPQPDDYFSHPERYSQNTPHGLESVKAINTAIDAIKNGEKDVKVKVYRAVPTSVKEGKLRNGDWVTPSKKYAEMHGTNRLEGKYRIIEDDVPATQLWWDGNDANEFGFDDGKAYKYKNAKNNRKLNDLVTYDDNGDVIPPSKRFNSRKSDVRFHRVTEVKSPIVEQKLKKHPDSLMKAGTYFSGGGLVEEGLKGIIDPVVAVEYDRKISGVYRNNFGQHIVTADVRDVDPKELVKHIDGEVEYFHASPVCKNYSQAKSNSGEVEIDKETAKSTADFIDAVKPRVVTIENVKGYKDSEAMKIITQALDKNGYKWDVDVYNAADFGGYTSRERLIVRAVKDGELPEKPKKQPRKGGWLEAVEDILPTLTVKESGVAPWMDARLKADGIDWQKVEKPLYVMGSAYADGKIPHAYGDEILPTLRTKSGDVIIIPGGKVLRADGRVLARITGLGDDYKLPKTESLAHTIIGNGIPVQLTQGVIAPLLNKDDLSGRNVLARLGSSIFKNNWDADKQKQVSDRVVNTANKLGGAEATVYTSVDEVPDAYLSDVKNGATGWYDPTTHTVHVYLPNCADANEAERTVLHEKIGHEGMEVLLGGEDGVRKFANFVYNSVAASTRGKILDIANKYDPDWKNPDRMNVGTQEYIAHLAEEGPKTAEDFSLWTKIKHYLIKLLKKLGIRVPGLLNDKDLRYYLMKAGKALHVWDEMPQEKQEAMMKQASNAEIKDALSDGAGKGKPRQKKGESTIQYMKRVQEWRKWQNAREDKENPEPPMFYDIDKDEAGKKEWAQLNKDWRERHHLVGEEPTGMPIRMENEEDDAYMNRIHEYEKWQAAMKDQEDPLPDMFAFEKKKQEEVKRKYEDWLAKHDLLEQQQADLDLYEGKIYPAETNPKADALEQQVMQDLAEVTSTDVSKEGAAMTVKHAVIHRRKNMEEASADDAIYINDVKNRIEKMADSGVFDKLLSDYKGKKNRAEKLAETIPYIIEAPRRLRDMAQNLNATGVFDKGHIHIQPADVEAIQPYVTDLIVETAKKHTEIKKGKEIEVYDDPKAVSEVASKMAQAINANHQGEEGFVPCDGTDILSKHVLKLVKERVVPGRINYKELSPEMQAAIDSIRDWYNYTYDWLMDNHTLKAGTGYNVDYVNHIWDKEKSDPEAYATFVENRQRTKSPNEKKRTISTLMEGVYAGLVPKTTDITKMMAYYSRSNIEAWANKTMLQELAGLNVIERNEKGEVISTDPLLSSSAPFNLEQYKYFEIPGVGPVWVYNVSPKQVKVKNPITDNEKVLYSEASAGDRFGVVFDTYQSSPFWKTFDTLASSAKKLELGFSGFHAGALTEVYMVQNMVEFGPKKAMANFMKYIFVDTAKNHELPCFANPEDFQEATSHLVKFGATNDYAAADVQNMFDNMRDAMMKVQEKLKDGNKISRTVAKASMALKVVTQLLSLINKGMDRALWDFLHDGLKLATYRMRADKTKERAKKKGWTEEELSRALDEDGQFVNDMFGGQHWDIVGASQRTIRFAGRCLLSPDWNKSTTSHFLAITGFGSVWNEATFENFKQYYQRLWHKELLPEDEGRRSRQISALLCYGIGFMVFYEGIANGINAAFRALDEEKERKKAEEIRKTNPSYKSMYELAYPDGMKWYDYLMRGNSLGQQSKIFLGRYEDGTEMYVRHGKQFREVPEYLFNHKGELEFPGPMVQRMIGKANPMVRMTLDDINYLSDFQASHADQEIQRKYGKTIGLLYKDALYWAPFLIPSQENKEFKAVDFFFPSSKGFSPWKAQSYFKDFILSGDMEGVVMTYQSCQRNGIDPEAQIKAAIGSVKALESAEMSDGVTSLQEASKRFDAAKSITEKKKMRQKMKKFLSQSDYKAFTQKEALDMVQGYLNGDEDLKEMEKAESKYLMKAKAEDMTEDWRIQNVWNGTIETYQEYQRLKDVDKAKANAFKNSKTNKRLFAARKAISAARRKMNKAKKQMDGTNDAAKLVEIRNTRKELLKTLNGME